MSYTYFNPSYLPSILTEVIRYFFYNYASPDLKWDKDIVKTQVFIDEIDKFNKDSVQGLPRILISRGQYSIMPSGLSDNLAESKTLRENRGDIKEHRVLLLEGVSQILIEATNKGTTEKMVDMATHFLSWASPIISNTKGFKKFGLPMAVSPCTPLREDVEIFQCTLNIPWSREEIFIYSETGKTLTSFDFKINYPETDTPLS